MRMFLAEGRGFSAWLIRIFTKSRISHSGLLFDNGEVLHSSIGGVQMTDMDYINSHYDNVVHYECLFAEAEGAANAVRQEHLGKGYDYWSFIGLGIAILIGLKKNPLGTHKQLMCTEVPAHWLNKAQAMNPSLAIPYTDPEMLTPVALQNFCDTRPGLFKKV